MLSDWPVYKEEWAFEAEHEATETIKEAVRAIRNVRTSMNVPPSKKATVYGSTYISDCSYCLFDGLSCLMLCLKFPLFIVYRQVRKHNGIFLFL